MTTSGAVPYYVDGVLLIWPVASIRCVGGVSPALRCWSLEVQLTTSVADRYWWAPRLSCVSCLNLQEGSVNKFLVDDKGVLLLVMFGLPPVYHLDDPIRGEKDPVDFNFRTCTYPP